MTAQWWLDAREPKKEVVAAHLVNLMWNGLTHLEADPHCRTSSRTIEALDGDDAVRGRARRILPDISALEWAESS